jgi:D-xylose transport system permease protein
MLNDPRLGAADPQAGSALEQMRRRLARADLGQAPTIIGLLIIWGVFQSQNQNFLTSLNLTNLLLQIAAMGTIAVGITLVLLLGEIDLSAGAVSGLCAAIMAVQNVKNGMPGPVAVLLGLIAGLAVGLFQGFWITKLRVPSFIVTLAGFLGFQGVLLQVLGTTGTVNLRDPFITGLAGTFFPDEVGWAVAVVFIIFLVIANFVSQRQRRASGLLTGTPLASYGRLLILALAILATVAVLNDNRGLPSAVVIFIGLIIVFDWLTRRTTWGRHVFAVGGNAEAARRASIDVDGIRISVFALCSMLAAAGGILGGSRLLAVNQSSGSGDLLLNSIAAAVIGGTSLFGGRGTVWGALLGALVIGSIANGMDLLAYGAPIKFMITGLVLLLAVTLDAVARRRRETRGR